MAHASSAFHLSLHPDIGLLAQCLGGFFAILTKRRLKRGVFTGIVDLQAAINRFLVEHNPNPKPFTWTKDQNYRRR
jgi:hypothetical protein